jgi:uncharacterized protein YacL
LNISVVEYIFSYHLKLQNDSISQKYVEILNEYVVSTTPVWVIVVSILGMIGGIVLACIAEQCMSDTAMWICFTCAVLCFVMSFTLGILMNTTDCFKEYSHVEYQVTIDDSVSMNEFLDKYEILDQEGKIYTVKERE